MSEFKRVQNLLAELQFQAKKSLGQNFLLNESVIEQIVQKALAGSPRKIVEIGPGLGALTLRLREKMKPGTELVLIEQDKVLAEYWRQQGENVLEKDALKVSWGELNATVIVSNLPYQISSSLVIDRCIGPTSIGYMVLMFQKEVAQRIMAVPRTKEYGLLSVMAQLHWKVDKIADAGSRDFYPSPQVSSRVLEFTRKEVSVESCQFLKFLKATFAQRRKKLLKNLKALNNEKEVLLNLEGALESMGFSGMTRAEELSPEHFLKLYEVYSGY